MDKKFKIRFPIKAKISLLFLSLAVLLILMESYLNFTYSKADLNSKILLNLAVLARSKAAHINTLMEEDIEDEFDLARRITVREALQGIENASPESEKLRSKILAVLKNAQAASGDTIKDADIITPDGKIMASTVAENVGRDLSQDVFFVKGKVGPYLSDPYMENGAFVYEMSAPMFSYGQEKERVIAVAKTKISATRLYNILSDYSGLGNTGEAVLGKRLDGEILFLGPLRHWQGLSSALSIPVGSSLAEPMRLAINKRTGFTTGSDYRGMEVLAAYYYIPITDWGLVVKIDKKEAFEPINNLRVQIILVACLLFLLSVLVITRFAAFISNPLKKLQEGTQAVAGGDLDYRVDVATRDEVGDLATHFNNMAANLKKITVSHDRLNREVEERRKTEEKLQEAMRVKSEFTSMVSHELRTPLAAIKEGISIVLDGILGTVNAEQKDFLNRTKANVDRLARLINDILDFQKLESGKIRPDIRENDIVKVVEETYDTMGLLTKQKGVDLVIKLDKDLPKMRFDRDRITQVLANLVNNAVKFTERGSIIITAVREENSVHITVKDSGQGIRQKDMGRLFKSFEQLEEAFERKGGTGLGLAISKEIVELHGGRIWAESEFGKGTAIHFTLPI